MGKDHAAGLRGAAGGELQKGDGGRVDLHRGTGIRAAGQAFGRDYRTPRLEVGDEAHQALRHYYQAGARRLHLGHGLCQESGG